MIAMTQKQMQHLLGYLGYYDGAADGIWGPLSRKAAEAFQRAHGLAADGSFTQETGKRLLEVISSGKDTEEKNFWEEIRYFRREEFRCTCGGRGCDGFPAEPRERLVRNAESAREQFGRAAIVSSGVRCDLRNGELPGSAANSLHLSGRAMDFAVTGVSAKELLAYVRTLPQVHEAYAIDASFVHMGVEKYEGG